MIDFKSGKLLEEKKGEVRGGLCEEKAPELGLEDKEKQVLHEQISLKPGGGVAQEIGNQHETDGKQVWTEVTKGITE